MSRLKTDAIRNVNASVDGITLDTSGNVAIPEGKVSIGTGTARQLLHLNVDDSGAANIVFTNTTTGTAASDGFVIGITGSEDGQIWHQESANIKFGTGDLERLRIHSTGKITVNSTGTQPSLTVGGFQLDMGSYPGTMRLSSGAGTSGTNSGSFTIIGSNHNASLENGANHGAQLNLINANSSDGNSTTVSFYNKNQLSTSRILGVNVSHTSRTGALVFMTSNGSHPVEKLRIDSSGRVGIGITNPAKALVIAKDSASAIIELRRTNTNTTGSIGAISWTAMDGHSVANMYALGDGDNEGAHLVFRTTSAAASNDPYNAATVERLRITSAGNVGIGCTPSNGFLEVKNTSYNGGSTGFLTLEGGGESGVMFKTSSYGNDQNKIGTNNNGHMFFRVAAGTRASLTSNGLCFNSDTAAANALDDYEEGTFSANFSTAGVSSTACTEETYIKIGRIVHFKLKLVTPSGSPSLGDLTITGLPFTMSSGNGTAQGHWQDGGSYNAVGGRIGGSQIERVNGSAFPSHGSAASWYFTGTYDVG